MKNYMPIRWVHDLTYRKLRELDSVYYLAEWIKHPLAVLVPYRIYREMEEKVRKSSVYQVTCARCEQEFETEGTEGTCAVCHTPYAIEWRATVKSPVQPETIMAKYES